MKSIKTIVVGAGGGGIASALLAAKRGESVTLLEQHSLLGGCASWFKRGPYTFDAGATTLSGVDVNGPIGKLFELLGSAPEMRLSNPGIVFHLSSGKIIRYHCDFDLWMKELDFHFPHLNHRPFWDLVRKVNYLGWSFLHQLTVPPLINAQGVTDVLTSKRHFWTPLKNLLKRPHYAQLSFSLFQSVDFVLKRFALDNSEYAELINGILLISAQVHKENTPFLVGAMALSYPSQTYAPHGGMKGLMDFFEHQLLRHNVKLMKKTRIESYSPHHVFLKGGGAMKADQIIFNIPLWNLLKLGTSESNIKKLQSEVSRRPGHWGAFTLYFGHKFLSSELYHQVHLNHPLVKNYFISLSHPEDQLRAPAGHQAVTVSTHVEALSSLNRQELERIIMEDMAMRFETHSPVFLCNGTPQTFERFTGREHGFVGGLPFLFGTNPATHLLGHVLDESGGIYRVGDTVFPGQGLCAVVSGAFFLDQYLKLGHKT